MVKVSPHYMLVITIRTTHETLSYFGKCVVQHFIRYCQTPLRHGTVIIMISQSQRGALGVLFRGLPETTDITTIKHGLKGIRDAPRRRRKWLHDWD